MRFEVSCDVRAPVDRVWAWWTDYGEPGHVENVSHGLGVSRRKVLSRADDVVVIRESIPLLRIPVFTHRLELHPATRAFRERGGRVLESWWRFEPAPEGTRVRREVHVGRAVAWMAPRGLARWLAQKDLDHHCRDAERALS